MAETREPAGDAAARILAAAGDLFAEKGFDAVSMTAVADLAGVSKANIFHHFGSKNDLYLAVMRNACNQSAAVMDDLEGEDGTFAERLNHFAHAHLANILREEKVSRLIQREIMENDPQRGRELAERVFGENFARLVGVMRNGQKRGELRTDIDAGMMATLLIAADIFFFQSREVARHLPDVRHLSKKPEAYSAMLVEILLHGIASKDEPEIKRKKK